jgi:uncharacterized membrane protein YjgN (DUF898 family)
MSSGFKKINIRFAGYFLLILFALFFGSITFFPHTHILEGVPIVHSHPFQSGNIPYGHHHSKGAFILIQFVSNFISIASVAFIGVVIIRMTSDIRAFISDEKFKPDIYFYTAHRPRAPDPCFYA